MRSIIQTLTFQATARASLAEPDAELRIDLAMGQLLGIAYPRHILQVEPIALTPVEELIEQIAPVISTHLNP